jgi:heme exporter protein D
VAQKDKVDRVVGWISVAVVVVALVVLVVVVATVGGHLRPLMHAARRLQLRLEQARQAQEPGVARLEEQASALEVSLAEMQERTAMLEESVQALREARTRWPGADKAQRT